MTRARIIQQGEREFCGDCALATPSDYIGNLDLQGQPICYRCPHSKRARIRSEVVCPNYTKRNT